MSLPALLHSEGRSAQGSDWNSALNAQPTDAKLVSMLKAPRKDPKTGEETKAGRFHYLTLYTNSQLLSVLQDTLHTGIFGSEYEKVADKMVAHLGEGTGADFSDTLLLSRLMLEQTQFKSLVEEIKTMFQSCMSVAKGDFTQIRTLRLNKKKVSDLQSFPFGINYSDSTVLKTLVGGVQEVNVFLKDITYAQARLGSMSQFTTYEAHLQVVLYDDFAVSESDISRASFAASFGMEGLVAMWILQMQRNRKPFRTKFTFHVPVKGIL